MAPTVGNRLITLSTSWDGRCQGVTEVLNVLSAAGYPMVTISTSLCNVISAVLETLGMGEGFRVVQSAEHLPFARIYITAYFEEAG